MITGTTYMTRGLLNKIFEKTLSNDEVDDLVMSGKLIRKFSYYQATEKLLRELNVIPSVVVVADFASLAKRKNFVMQDLMEIFNCNKDTVKVIIKKYFQRRYNYYYKNDLINQYILDGQEEYEI